MSKSKKTIWFIGILIIFFVFIATKIPIQSDDWAWGGTIGIDRLNSGFRDYNGRYLGNVLIIAITRSILLRIMVMGIAPVVLIALISRQAYEFKIRNYLVVTTLILFMPIGILNQTITWMSGFVNFVPPMIGIFIYLYVFKDSFTNKESEYSSWLAVWLVPIGIGTQLFAEHITVYVVILAIVAIIYTYINKKRIILGQVSFAISSIIGAIIMFTNTGYRQLGNGSHKSMSLGIVDAINTAINQYFNIINPNFFMKMTLVSVLVAAIGISIIIKYHKVNGETLNRKSIILILTQIVYPTYLVIKNYFYDITFYGNNMISIAEGILSLIFYMSVLGVVILYTLDRRYKEKLVFMILSAIILIAPILIISPVSDRCYLATYLFIVAFIMEGTNYLDLIDGYLGKIIDYILVVLILGNSIMFSYIMNEISIDETIRHTSIQYQLENQEEVIYVPRLKHTRYLYSPNLYFNNEWYDWIFRGYYNLDKEIILKMGYFMDEVELSNYLDMIDDEKYTIIMSIKDEGTKGLNEKIISQLKKLGLQADLEGKYRWSYVSVINNGKVVVEKLSEDTIEEKIELDKNTIKIISSGYNNEKISSIKINNQEFSQNARGLNIVIYDNEIQQVVDSVCFDTYNGTKANSGR